MFESFEIGSLTRHWGKAVMGLLLPITGCSSLYWVNPSDVAHVRRLGHVVTAPQNPVGSGPHLKLPLVDKVDRMQVSISTMKLEQFSVNTVDNQEIKLDINLTYRVPPQSAYYLLYNVGGTGNIDINDTIKPIVMNKAAEIFSGTNTNSISANFGHLQRDVSTSVKAVLENKFKIELISLQIAHIGYSPVFRTTNDNAVSSKNLAISEQNKVLVQKAKADQEIETARGHAEASRMNGRGEADRLKMLVEAAGGAENYARIKQAEAWKGDTPQVVVSGSNTNVPYLLPIPHIK